MLNRPDSANARLTPVTRFQRRARQRKNVTRALPAHVRPLASSRPSTCTRGLLRTRSDRRARAAADGGGGVAVAGAGGGAGSSGTSARPRHHAEAVSAASLPRKSQVVLVDAS